MKLKPLGDRVIFSKYAGTEVKVEEEEYTIVSQNEWYRRGRHNYGNSADAGACPGGTEKYCCGGTPMILRKGMKKAKEAAVRAIEKVSENGVIAIEESKTMRTEIDVVEGMQLKDESVPLRCEFEKRAWLYRL